ncbi:FMN-dependent NADH-azoreductase [Cerasicoccus maritimus]|uniref:FMN-dependent NADH-azoreductase n=1 Tax=Cerasicoccus maritimus TaxID=490089 RepID=UPI0028529F2C|nr:NAD(P)H-dependent oxidoreductase [Cerasicoccus maritimus]
METLLVIQSSGRHTRSITRRLTGRFIEQWRAAHPQGVVVERDVTDNPPPVVNESWIAGAYCAPEERTGAMREALAVSDEVVSEVQRADTIVIGAPIYNFGLPAQLKAWVDQLVRVGATFRIDPTQQPAYQPLLVAKPVKVIVSAGDAALHPGGELWAMNHLEPYLQTVLGFVGLTDVEFLRVGNAEFRDDAMRASIEAVENRITKICQPGDALAV